MTAKFKVNGVEVEAEAGSSLLDAVRQNGFEVPSLCHHEAVTPYGACRLCLVEVTRGGRKKITTSCNYEVQGGIEVLTDSEQIRRHRAMVLELLLAEAPRSVSLRSFAAAHGVRNSRFARPDAPALLDEREGCILCGLCVRACEEMGRDAISLLQRGVSKEVGPPPGGEADSCIGCGSCHAVCPTGHIAMRDTAKAREIWGRMFDFVLCEGCGGPVITTAHRDHAIERGGLPADYYLRCAECKKSGLAARFAKVGS